MNLLINESSVSRTALPPLKIWSPLWDKLMRKRMHEQGSIKWVKWSTNSGARQQPLWNSSSRILFQSNLKNDAYLGWSIGRIFIQIGSIGQHPQTACVECGVSISGSE